MLEVQSFKNILDAVGKLSSWMEDAGRAGGSLGKPPDALVKEFETALQSPQTVDNSPPIEPLKSEAVETSPSTVIGESDLFRVPSENSVISIEPTGNAEDVLKLQTDKLSDAQEIHIERGLDAVDSAQNEPNPIDAAKQLLDFLSKDATEISPVDLLRAQRLIGIIKVGAESGIKVSEGISETFEQLLEQQG